MSEKMDECFKKQKTRNIGTIVPHCFKCGDLLDTDPNFENGWSHHEQQRVKCECGHETELLLEYCYFSNEKEEPNQDLIDPVYNHTMKG